MARYNVRVKLRRIPLRVWTVLGCVVVILIIGTVLVQHVYFSNLQPVSNSNSLQYVTIASGSSAEQIAKQLKTDGLIRSSQVFEWYVTIHNDRDKLQAGTYSFAPSQSTPDIAQAIADGKIATKLVTILSGQTLAEIQQTFIKSGFSAASVSAAFNVNLYRSSYPALADNPASASLEGFIWPDSYQKNSSTSPSQIVAEALTEMQQHLTQNVRDGFAAQGLSVFQGVTLASIVEQEVPDQNDRNQVAQVFIKRLQIGMQLGSDVTAYYGAALAGVAPSLSYDSPYNTLIHSGLPPGPISTVSDSSLEAVAYPANTDWLYFVTGDDGTTHYAQTLQQHQANVSQYCHKLCSQD
jgi:peptidoglycan lytic transglycosylase G